MVGFDNHVQGEHDNHRHHKTRRHTYRCTKGNRDIIRTRNARVNEQIKGHKITVTMTIRVFKL